MIKLKLFPAANQWIPESAFCYVFLAWQELLAKITCLPRHHPVPGVTGAAGSSKQEPSKHSSHQHYLWDAYIHFSTSTTIFVMQLWASVPHSCSKVKCPGDCRNFQAVPLSPAPSLTEVVEVLHQVRSPAESFQSAPIRLRPTSQWAFSSFLAYICWLIWITSALNYFSK